MEFTKKKRQLPILLISIEFWSMWINIWNHFNVWFHFTILVNNTWMDLWELSRLNTVWELNNSINVESIEFLIEIRPNVANTKCELFPWEMQQKTLWVMIIPTTSNSMPLSCSRSAIVMPLFCCFFGCNCGFPFPYLFLFRTVCKQKWTTTEKLFVLRNYLCSVATVFGQSQLSIQFGICIRNVLSQIIIITYVKSSE